MALSHAETQRLLERLIFDEEKPQDWCQDVWDMSPTLGETAAKLVEVFEDVLECCPAEKLEDLLKGYYAKTME